MFSEEPTCETLCHITRSKNSDFHAVVLFLIQISETSEICILAIRSQTPTNRL